MRRCVDTTTGQAYAVKVIPKRTHEGKDRAPFIAREVHMWRTLAALSPRVAGLQGAYQDANNIFLVQELLLDDMQKLLDQQVGGASLSLLSSMCCCACLLDPIPGLRMHRVDFDVSAQYHQHFKGTPAQQSQQPTKQKC